MRVGYWFMVDKKSVYTIKFLCFTAESMLKLALNQASSRGFISFPWEWIKSSMLTTFLFNRFLYYIKCLRGLCHGKYSRIYMYLILLKLVFFFVEMEYVSCVGSPNYFGCKICAIIFFSLVHY